MAEMTILEIPNQSLLQNFLSHPCVCPTLAETRDATTNKIIPENPVGKMLQATITLTGSTVPQILPLISFFNKFSPATLQNNPSVKKMHQNAKQIAKGCDEIILSTAALLSEVQFERKTHVAHLSSYRFSDAMNQILKTSTNVGEKALEIKNEAPQTMFVGSCHGETEIDQPIDNTLKAISDFVLTHRHYFRTAYDALKKG